jgi:hypothetical protein
VYGRATWLLVVKQVGEVEGGVAPEVMAAAIVVALVAAPVVADDVRACMRDGRAGLHASELQKESLVQA